MPTTAVVNRTRMAESFMLDVEMMIMVESKRLCMMSVAITRLKKL